MKITSKYETTVVAEKEFKPGEPFDLPKDEAMHLIDRGTHEKFIAQKIRQQKPQTAEASPPDSNPDNAEQ